MSDVKLLLLHSKSWNHLTVYKKSIPARLKMLSNVNKSYIFNIYVWTGFGIK